MTLITTHHPDHTHIALTGELDAKTSPPITQAALAAMREGGTPRLVLDLAEVTFMSSPGLRLLLTLYKQGQASGILVEAVNPQPGVAKMLHMAGFDQMMTITTEGS